MIDTARSIGLSASRSSDQSSLLGAAESLFPSGALGTFRLPPELDVVIAEGHGSRVRDLAGREYIDYVLGSGPLILGHSHPRVVEAIKEQAERGTSFYLLNEPAIALAAEIAAVFESETQVIFTSSGAEATAYALRLARAFTGRPRVVKFAGAYHGHNDYALLEAWATAWKPGEAPSVGSAGIPDATAKTVDVLPYNDSAAVAAHLQRHGKDIAAIIVEPYQRVLAPLDGFLKDLEELARRHGIVLISDEVVTGFRFHYGTAQAEYGFTADLTTFGKIIGGGLPVAAVAGRPDILTLADVRRKGTPSYVYASGTLNGYSLGAAAGLATLKELKAAGTYERLAGAGERLRASLRRSFDAAGIQAAVLGRDSMFHWAFGISQQPVNAADLAAADAAAGNRLSLDLIRAGLMFNPGVRSFVSLAHTDEDLSRTEAAFEEAVARSI